MTIQIGYGSDRRSPNPKGCYGTRSSGKVMLNGGFNGAPTTTFETIEQDHWDKIFPNGFKGPHLKEENNGEVEQR